MRIGLRGRFIAFVSAIVIAFGVVLTALAVRVQNDRLRHELDERGKLLTTVVANHVTDSLVLLDVSQLRQMIADTLVQENVLGAVIFDEDGRVLTDGRVENPSRHQLIDEAALKHVAVSDALLVEFLGDVMTVTKPVYLGDRLLGGVRLNYSRAGLAEDQAILARRTALVGAVFAILGVLAAALLTEAVTRPLKEVIEATRAVSEGKPVPTLQVRTADEVGELAAAFNEMTRRLRETTVSRDYLDRVLETMGECLVVTRRDGTIARANNAACALAGATENELVGRHCSDLIRAPEGYTSLLHALNPEGSVQGLETKLLTSTAEEIPILVSIAAMDESQGSRRGYVIVAADISERLRIERQREEFVTMIHHEVRTPLTAVRGAIGLLDGGVAGDLGETGRELVANALSLGRARRHRDEPLPHRQATGDVLLNVKLDAAEPEEARRMLGLEA